MEARNRIRTNQERGKTLREELADARSCTTGVIVKAKHHRLGLTVKDFVKEAKETQREETRIAEEKQHHTFELRDKGEVGDFLGIRIEKTGSKRFTLTHNGLINKVLKEASIESYNNTKTTTALTPLGKDVDG